VNDDIHIVYHLFQAPGWEKLFCEQMGLLALSGLLECASLTISVNGTAYVPKPKAKKLAIIQRDNGFHERPTLHIASKIAKQHPAAKIFYFHSKGITFPSSNKDDWRMVMQHFLISRWKEVVQKLDAFDIVSMNWRNIPCPHGSGNFWWATASYLSTLDLAFMDAPDRFLCEFWIGTGNGSVYNMHETGLEHYSAPCPIQSYCPSFFIEEGK
jgi:hypothetical protein